MSPDNTRPQGCKKAVGGYAGFPAESLAEAAKILTQHIKDYKIDTQMQQDRETGLLVNFIQDLESKFKAQVDAFVERLKAANESGRQRRRARSKPRVRQATRRTRRSCST